MMTAAKIYILIFLCGAMLFVGCNQRAVVLENIEELQSDGLFELSEPEDIPEVTEKITENKEFSEEEQAVIDFISRNYSAIFLDYRLMLTKFYAYGYNLPVDMPPGIGEYVAQDFEVYNTDNHIIIVVGLDVPETEGRKHELFDYIEGEFIKVGEAGTTCLLLKDSEGNNIIAEQDLWSDVTNHNIKLSNFVIQDNELERDTFINIADKKDEISGAEYSFFSWEDIEEFLSDYIPADKFITEEILMEIADKSKAENEKYINWKDLYVNYVTYNSQRDSEISLYSPDKAEIPYLVLDNQMYGIENNTVVFYGVYEGTDDLIKYSVFPSSKYYEVIYTY